jgi:hypothetical protein
MYSSPGTRRTPLTAAGHPPGSLLRRPSPLIESERNAALDPVPRLIFLHITESQSVGITDYAAVASAIFAACATFIALLSVRQSRGLQELSVRPYLNGQLIQSGNQPLDFAVQNVGAGPARAVGFCVVLRNEYLRGYAAPNMGGLFKPGDRAVITTTFSGGGSEPAGVLTCWDSNEGFHVFDFATGRRKSWRPKRWWRRGQIPSGKPEDALAVFDPTLSVTGLTKVQGRGSIRP